MAAGGGRGVGGGGGGGSGGGGGGGCGGGSGGGQLIFGLSGNVLEELVGMSKDKTFQADSLTQSDGESDLGSAYMSMLRACKAVSSVPPPTDGEHKAGVTAAPVQPRSLSASEEDRSKEQAVWEKVCGIRQARLKFHSVRPGAHPDKHSFVDVYKPSGNFAQAFKASRAHNWECQTQLRAFVFCADSFNFDQQGAVKPLLDWTEEMTQLLRWLAPLKDNNTMVMFFDGRSKAIRRRLDDWICEHYPDETKQAELWVTCAGLTAGNTDPREPKRRVAFSENCRECVSVGLPVPKQVMKAKPRPCFSVCGEATTHSQSYTAVPKRSLESLPRLQPTEKKTMIRNDVAELPANMADVASNGHALFWSEVRTVGLLSQLLSDFGVAHVVDLAPASGALAAAAAMNHLTYDGFCFNDMHKQWLDGVLDRAMLRVLSDSDVPNHDKGFSDDIKKSVSVSIEDAEQLISSQSMDKTQDKKAETNSSDSTDD